MAFNNVTQNGEIQSFCKGIVLSKMAKLQTVIYGSIARKFHGLSDADKALLDQTNINWQTRLKILSEKLELEPTSDIDFLVHEKDLNIIREIAFQIGEQVKVFFPDVTKITIRVIKAINPGTIRVRVEGFRVTDFTICSEQLLNKLRPYESCGCFSCFIPPLNFLKLDLWRFLVRPWITHPLSPLSSISAAFNLPRTLQALELLLTDVLRPNNLQEMPIWKVSINKITTKDIIYGGMTALAWLLHYLNFGVVKVTETQHEWQMEIPRFFNWDSEVHLSTDDSETTQDALENEQFTFVSDILPPYKPTMPRVVYTPSYSAPIVYANVGGINIFSPSMIGAECALLAYEDHLDPNQARVAFYWLREIIQKKPDLLLAIDILPNLATCIEQNSLNSTIKPRSIHARIAGLRHVSNIEIID